jgi:hypothetical protein
MHAVLLLLHTYCVLHAAAAARCMHGGEALWQRIVDHTDDQRTGGTAPDFLSVDQFIQCNLKLVPGKRDVTEALFRPCEFSCHIVVR